MFSSGKHAKLTADPKPWLHRHYAEWCYDNDTRMATNNGIGNVFDPRPKYDRPLMNPANPILSDFRENCPTWSGDDVGDYLETIASLRTEHYRSETGRAQRDHARKVLTRLAQLADGNTE